MNNVLKMLKQASEAERAAYEDYVTSFTRSGIVGLVQDGGFEFEKAAEAVGEAIEADPTAAAMLTNVHLFEKLAAYVEEMEGQMADLEKKAAEAGSEVILLDDLNPLTKIANSGFTDEQVDLMAHLPDDLLDKIASQQEQPWTMGNGVTVDTSDRNPFADFLLDRSN